MDDNNLRLGAGPNLPDTEFVRLKLDLVVVPVDVMTLLRRHATHRGGCACSSMELLTGYSMIFVEEGEVQYDENYAYADPSDIFVPGEGNYYRRVIQKD